MISYRCNAGLPVIKKPGFISTRCTDVWSIRTTKDELYMELVVFEINMELDFANF